MGIIAYTIVHKETELPLRKKYWCSPQTKNGWPAREGDIPVPIKDTRIKPYTEGNDIYLAGSLVGAQRTLLRVHKWWPDSFKIVELTNELS